MRSPWKSKLRGAVGRYQEVVGRKGSRRWNCFYNWLHEVPDIVLVFKCLISFVSVFHLKTKRARTRENIYKKALIPRPIVNPQPSSHIPPIFSKKTWTPTQLSQFWGKFISPLWRRMGSFIRWYRKRPVAWNVLSTTQAREKQHHSL